MKPDITFKTRLIYNESHILPVCEASKALFHLIRRGTIKSDELPYVARMGFNIKIIGDTRDLSKELDRYKLHYKYIKPGEINYVD